ncbi:MAG: hypothetical protein VYC69_03500, partial [Chloroflexota bacterium]|nr:hypothetical protein [Chloroflexota bacterium]
MPEFTSHIQETPSWAELATSDYQGDLTFCSAPFGREDEANEMSPGMYYHMQKLRGLEVAALYQQGMRKSSRACRPIGRSISSLMTFKNCRNRPR